MLWITGQQRGAQASGGPLLRVHGARLLGDEVVDALAFLEHHLPADAGGRTLDEEVDELHLGLAKAIGVGDIPRAAGRGGVDAGSAASLEAHLLQHVLEVLARGKLGELDHRAGTQASSQVGGAGEDISEVVVVHEVLALSLEHLADGVARGGEANEDVLNVVALLHGDDAHLVLLVDPAEEVLILVVEDATGIGPVAATARGEQKSGVGLLEEVATLAEFLLLLLGHAVGLRGVGARAVEGEVVARHGSGHVQEAGDNHALELATALECACGGEMCATDGAASAAARGEYVLAVATVVAGGVNLSGGEVGRVHVRRVLGVGSVTTVTRGDDGIEELLESLVGLFVTGD